MDSVEVGDAQADFVLHLVPHFVQIPHFLIKCGAQVRDEVALSVQSSSEYGLPAIPTGLDHSAQGWPPRPTLGIAMIGRPQL